MFVINPRKADPLPPPPDAPTWLLLPREPPPPPPPPSRNNNILVVPAVGVYDVPLVNTLTLIRAPGTSVAAI
jgi:hypothetical protein